MTVDPATRRWLTIRETADHFGVHPATVRNMIARGELEAHRLGPRLVRITASSVSGAHRRLATRRVAS